MLKLWSADNAALVLARTILRREPSVALEIYLGGERTEGAVSLHDFRIAALNSLLEKSSRLAVVSDITEDLSLPEKIVSVPSELLNSFASRGLSDTVEFRRLARKYLRAVKNANCQEVLFFSGVLAEEKTQQILSHLLGTQIKPVYLTDFLPEELFAPTEKQKLQIFTSGNLHRVHAEAEKFLHQKLSQDALVTR